MNTTTTAPRPTASKQPATHASAKPGLLIQPYLFFGGRCEEALEFYRGAVGAEVTMLMKFKDCPPPTEPGGCAPDPAMADKVMHGNVRIGSSEVLVSDGCGEGQANFQGFALSLTAPDVAEAERRFAALSQGGQVQQPLTKTFFSPSFGMLTDRFGVMWMVYVKGN